jgi:hypothetical protein
MFNEFAEFVAMHYSLSRRTDTEYWRSHFNKDFFATAKRPISAFDAVIDNRAFTHISPLTGGYSWIQVGMNYSPLDSISARLGEIECPSDYKSFYHAEISYLNNRKNLWEKIISQQPTLYEYLRDNIYFEKTGHSD